MSYKATTTVWDKVTLPTAVDGTESRPFSIPKGASSVTFHVPDLVGAATLKIQALTPQDGDRDTEVWTDLKYADMAATTLGFVAIAAIPESSAITFPGVSLGGGILRFVASGAQTGAADALTVRIGWNYQS